MPLTPFGSPISKKKKLRDSQGSSSSEDVILRALFDFDEEVDEGDYVTDADENAKNSLASSQDSASEDSEEKSEESPRHFHNLFGFSLGVNVMTRSPHGHLPEVPAPISPLIFSMGNVPSKIGSMDDMVHFILMSHLVSINRANDQEGVQPDAPNPNQDANDENSDANDENPRCGPSCSIM